MSKDLVERLRLKAARVFGSAQPIESEAADLIERQSKIIEAMDKALAPFARCSEVYPSSDGDADAGFAGLHDRRCPVFVRDFHAAKDARALTQEGEA